MALQIYDEVQKKSGPHQFWEGYILWIFSNSHIVNCLLPDVLVRYHHRLTDFDMWDICREFQMDLTKSSGKFPGSEGGLQPETLTWAKAEAGSPPVEPPPIEPPPVEPPPVEPPPVEPPPVEPPMTEYKIIVKERIPVKKGILPLIVGNWPANGVKGRVISPSGKVVNFTTGDKAGDYGPGGWSGEYCREAGAYHVTIGDVSADIETDGKQFIQLTYKKGQAQELQVRLVSKLLDRPKGEAILVELDKNSTTSGIFNIETV